MKDLVIVEHQDERVLTTEQLAQAYGTETTNIKSNYNASKDKFIEGMHYFKLEGVDLKAFKDSVRNSDLVGKNANQLYLWTKRGASRHCKMLGTDKAWEQFDILEESYFNPKSRLLTNDLSPQLQLLINMELKQKELEARQDKQEVALQGIRDVVALNPNDWRKESAALINKMAKKLGGCEHIKEIRSEAYKLLDERMGVDLKRRLTFKRQRLAVEGVCKSKQDKLNPLDVVAEDKKLIEGYIAIVKEMAIKCGVTIGSIKNDAGQATADTPQQ